MTQMPITIVLLHGAFQTAACWDRVRPLLQARGFTVQAVNLPGRDGDARTPAELTQALYRDTVLAAMAGLSQPLVLVGHSFGGITVSNVAEAAPERLRLAVYLAAYLPQDGDSLQSLAASDPDSRTGAYFRLSPDHTLASIADEGQVPLFGNDASPADAELIAGSMIPEPAGPQGAPVHLTPERFGRVRKAYLRTALDQVVSPALQDRMVQAAGIPAALVRPLQAGHAAYITQPQAVADAIAELALA